MARQERVALAGLSPMARRSGLETRVRSILGEHSRVGFSRSSSLALGAVALGLVMPLAACQVTNRTTSETKAETRVASTPPPHAGVEAERTAADAARVAPEATAKAHVETSLAESPGDDDRAQASTREAIEAAEAELRALRLEADDLAGDDWPDIEADIAEAFENARGDWQVALENARASLAKMDWDALRAETLAEAQAAQAEAHAETRLELQGAQRERETALREAEEERRRALREQQRALREAQRERERALQEAERQRERARRDAERAREHSRKEDVPRPAPGFAPSPPRTPSSGYSLGFTVSTDGGAFAVVNLGASEWAESLHAWDSGLATLARATETASGEDLGTLRLSLAGMRKGLDGLELSAHAWARSDGDRRIASLRVARSREALRAVRASLNDTCN
jgi:hypothetical protein